MFNNASFNNSAIAAFITGILGNMPGLSSGVNSPSEKWFKSGIPHLRKHRNTTQLIVDGKGFLVLGGELGNSSASSLDYMKPIWPKLVEMNLNTVLAPVYWELMEPQQGKFDFSLVDGLIDSARGHNLRLVLLWFASWKNSMSCYAPEWIKTDHEQFPRARLQNGQPQEILSAFYESNLGADKHAFTELMKHIYKVDGKAHTVIMVQVENEIGMLGNARDYCGAANEAFVQQVPKQLIDYLSANKDSLVPEFCQRWQQGGCKTSGAWEEVFGKGLEADEIFMAWYYAKYVNEIAQAGKKQYPLPMFVNAALNRPDYKPGQYPSAGPLPHLMDIWKAAADQIDFLSPDLYFPDIIKWCEQYHRPDNPLFIPEIQNGSNAPARAFYVFGRYNAMGFSPFGIDSVQQPACSPISKAYKVLSQLTPLLLDNQSADTVEGVLLDKEQQFVELTMGGYGLKVSHDYTWQWSSGPKDEGIWPQAGGVIISTGPDEFIVAGGGIIVTFAPVGSQAMVGITEIREGEFKTGKWVPGGQLNGDQSHQGRHLRLPGGDFGIQRIKLYKYY